MSGVILKKSTDPSHLLRIIIVTGVVYILGMLPFFLQIHHPPHEPRKFASLSHVYFFRQIFELLLVVTLSISRCLNISLKCFHYGLHIFGHHSLSRSISRCLKMTDEGFAEPLHHTQSRLLLEYRADWPK